MITIQNINNIKNNYFTIYTDITDFCNFSCKYCCTKNYRTNKQLDLDIFQQFLDKFKTDKQIHLMLLGGEPTLHPKLLSFIQYNIDKKISIFTNFSANISLYKQLLEHNCFLNLSIHYYNKASISKILTKYKQLLDYKDNIFVTVMYDNINSDFSKNIYLEFLKLFNIYNIDLDQLDISQLLSTQTYTINYTDNQNIIFKNLHDILPNKKDELYNYIEKNNTVVITEDQLFEKLGKNMFKNWVCNASKECIYVNTNGEIYPCQMLFNYSTYRKKYIIGNILNMFSMKKILCPFKYYCNMPEITKYKLF